MIKLLIGGSPCTFWSIAQKNAMKKARIPVMLCEHIVDICEE